MLFIGFVILFLFSPFATCETEETNLADKSSLRSEAADHRALKWFPFLAVVSFPNTKCTSGMGTGVCYTKSQCLAKGGVDGNSPCAQGYGTCCMFTTSCSGMPGMVTVTQNLTHVVKGMATNGTQQPCQIKIPRQPGVCQIRVDFTEFNILDSGPDGNCPMDSVVFSGASNLPNGLTLCGKAAGQHLYMHYGDSESLSISPNLMQTGSNYDFQITMIKCNSPERAPDGCTQYYAAPRSTVMSFNYPTQQLNNQKYSVCVKSNTGNSITWTACPAPMGGAMTPFFISGDVAPIPPGTPLPSRSGTTECPTDYVLIPPGEIRCGLNWTDSVISTVKPFTLYVNFDEGEEPPEPPFNPETGCPLGFTCDNPDPADPMGKCPAGSTCTGPAYLADLIDNGNTGFCLMYAVA